VAVHRAGARVDDAAHAGPPGRFQQLDGAVHVVVVRCPGVGDRAGHAWQGGHVEDHLHAVRGTVAVGGAANVSLEEVHAGHAVQVVPRAGREIVEDADLVPVVPQLLDDVRPDESGATGDKAAKRRNWHGVLAQTRVAGAVAPRCRTTSAFGWTVPWKAALLVTWMCAPGPIAMSP